MTQLPIRTFDYDASQIRVIERPDGPWFIAADVCRILDIDTSVSVNGQNRSDVGGNSYRSGGLDDDEKATHIVSTPSGEQTMVMVSEPGLYSLVLKSRKPEAKAFKRWITHEVLPAIRQTGAYATPRELTRLELIDLARESELARLETERQNAELAYQLRLQEPKVALYDVAMQAVNAQPIGTVAKVLNIGPNKLFAWLRDEGILLSHGARYNLPRAEYMERQYFEVREYSITHFTSGIENKAQTLVTPKGLAWIQRRWADTHALVAQ